MRARILDCHFRNRELRAKLVDMGFQLAQLPFESQ